MNHAFLEMTGFLNDDLIGHGPPHPYWPPESMDEIEASFSKILRGQFQSFELTFMKKNGVRFPVILSPSAVKSHNGGTNNYFATVKDISATVETRNALQESEANAKALLDAIPDLMFRLDREGRYLDYKAPKSELFHQDDSIIGRKNRDLTPSDFADLIDAKISKSLEQRKMEVFEYELPVPGLGLRTFEARMVPSGSDEVTAISRDITDWKKTQQDLLEKNMQLETSNAEKDKFFSILAHDLRSPFNAFLGFTQLMAEELPSMTLDEIQQIAVSMQKSATNLYRLLDNLLEWSRLQRNVTSFNPEAFVVLPVISEALRPAMEYAEKKEIGLMCEVAVDLTAYADVHMVETIMRNLVSNAVKFTSNGEKIMISAVTCKERGVEICITDNGIGMSKEFVQKLFHLDGSTTRPGTNGEPSTGLGLIICREFVEKHGGKIWAESEEGKGSSFFFTLPGLKS